MQPTSQISFNCRTPHATADYTTGVSLHSHTSLSLETLSFIHGMFAKMPVLGAMFEHYDKRCRERYGLELDFESAHWRPPLLPKMAFDLEAGQIRQLGLKPMVSITDHDTIQAPLLLRTIPSARAIPVSTEWSAPYGSTAFHLGVHNLPSATAAEWMQRMEAYTAAPDDATLTALLAELHAIPQVLLVLNHPIWDLHKIGDAAHEQELARFLTGNNQYMHALELNGLRHARENSQVKKLARAWNQVLISGGDRHGLEPNANINLTNARSFTEFVEEVRVERRSHVLFLDQYERPWEQRILESTLDAICDHPHFSPGWQRWDERAFHRDAQGVLRPLSELWVGGKPPLPLHVAIHATRMLRSRTLSRMLSLGFPGVNAGVLDHEAA